MMSTEDKGHRCIRIFGLQRKLEDVKLFHLRSGKSEINSRIDRLTLHQSQTWVLTDLKVLIITFPQQQQLWLTHRGIEVKSCALCSAAGMQPLTYDQNTSWVGPAQDPTGLKTNNRQQSVHRCTESCSLAYVNKHREDATEGKRKSDFSREPNCGSASKPNLTCTCSFGQQKEFESMFETAAASSALQF